MPKLTSYEKLKEVLRTLNRQAFDPIELRKVLLKAMANSPYGFPPEFGVRHLFDWGVEEGYILDWEKPQGYAVLLDRRRRCQS